MRLTHGRLLIAAAGLAAVVAGVLGHTIGLPVALSFLAGVAVGGGSFSAVAWRVRAVTARSRLQRLLGGLLRSAYYVLIVGALYVLIVVWRVEVLWLVIGYTYALTVFALYMAGVGPRGPGRPPGGDK